MGHTKRQTLRQTDRDAYSGAHKETDTETERERDAYSGAHKETDTETERQRETERCVYWGTQRDRH